MLTFHNDIEIKNKYLKRLQNHYKADDFVKGIYWENGKGCGVGCTIHSGDHSAYERELGIPRWWAKIQDNMFERLDLVDAKEWPILSLSSVPVGIELKLGPTMLCILNFVKNNVDLKDLSEIEKSLDRVIYLYKNGGTKEEFNAAHIPVDSYDYMLIPDAASYASSAASYASSAASYAASAASYAASYAASAASYAADAAAHAAEAIAYGSARSSAYMYSNKKLSEQLIRAWSESK